MANSAIFDRFEAVFLAFNPPSQVDLAAHVWVRKDALVIASRFVLAFNCKAGPDPVQAADALSLPENQLAKEVFFMTAYLFELPGNAFSFNAWTGSSDHRMTQAFWRRYTQEPTMTREDVALLAGPSGSQWLTSIDHAADDPLPSTCNQLWGLRVSLESLSLPWHSKERLKVLNKHSVSDLIDYHDTYRTWGPLADSVRTNKKEIVYEIVSREKFEMRKVEKGQPEQILPWDEHPGQPSSYVVLTRISRFEEIYNLRDYLAQTRLYMGIRMSQAPQRRWNRYSPRNWAYFTTIVRGQAGQVGQDCRSMEKEAAKLVSSASVPKTKPPSIPSHQPATDPTSQTIIVPEVDMAMDVAKSNRMWHVKHVLHIHGVKEQDITKVSCLNTEFARQAVRSIKLLHEKDGENGYGWDKPASAMILRAVVSNDDGWLFQ